MFFQKHYKNKDPIAQRSTHYLLILTFLIFLTYFVLNKGFAPWRYSAIFAIIGIGLILRRQFILPEKLMILFCCASLVCVTLPYHLFNRFDAIPTLDFKFLSRVINQYSWFAAFILLPSIFHYARFKPKHLNLILICITVLILVFNSIINTQLELNRNVLAKFFNPLIDYDLGMIAICIITMVLSFSLKKNWSAIVLTISTFAIFAIMLHGSRGTWIGLPLVLILIFLSYYKTQLKACYWLISLFIIFIGINLMIPQSPITQRLNHSQHEYQSMVDDEYQNSSGVRLLLWQESVTLFQQHPMLGVGIYGIEQANCKLFEAKKIPHCFQHQHNIVFHEMAAHGLLGLLGLFVTYLAALLFFLKHWFHQNKTIHNLSCAGLAFVLYHFCSGMTEHYLFFIQNTYLFYLLSVTLMSFIVLKKAGNPT